MEYTKIGYTLLTDKKKWKIQGVLRVFNSLLEMKEFLKLGKHDTVFDYARRNNLIIYLNVNDSGFHPAYHHKSMLGV